MSPTGGQKPLKSSINTIGFEMQINIKILNPDAAKYLPRQATVYSAGLDIHAAIDAPLVVRPGQTLMIPTGLAMAVPEGYAAMLLPRSGLGHKNGIVLGNLVGLIDGDYRGEVKVSAWNRLPERRARCDDGSVLEMNSYVLQPWERIAQMVIVPFQTVDWKIVESLSETDRGAGGFGSSGTR